MTEMQSADKRAERGPLETMATLDRLLSSIPMHAVDDFRYSYHDRLDRFDYYVIRAVNARGRRVCHFDPPFANLTVNRAKIFHNSERKITILFINKLQQNKFLSTNIKKEKEAVKIFSFSHVLLDFLRI